MSPDVPDARTPATGRRDGDCASMRQHLADADTADGVAPRFGFVLAGTLGRLAAAEYRCCSFGSYTLVVDGTGPCLEIRVPGDAAGTLAAVAVRPDAEAVR